MEAARAGQARISNPILKGFNPDPSICRAGDDYYIATSTFEWYPGVRIYHSTDLSTWRLAACPLDRPDLLDMSGNPDSGGVWAPCLSHCDGLFYLAYTDVKRRKGNFTDAHNYLTSCASIDGAWSRRIHLNSSGFDPSIYHDDDGRKWCLNMVWDHRSDRSRFAGVALQEYSPDEKRLVGERRIIFEGGELGFTEGPHLYKRNGYYYLVTAEGGTGYGHAVTMARSRFIHGPYEPDPSGPVITCRHDSDWPLQRAGHADMVETPAGEIWMVHLVSRPLEGTRLSPVGRETAIQRLEHTDDGWFRLPNGETLPRLEVERPKLARRDEPEELRHDDFDRPELHPDYQWLRTPWPEEFMSLTERPGYLRLYGMESPGSLFRQALVARRLTAFNCVASTCLDYRPDNFQQLAGLIVYYNSSKFHYLYVCGDDGAGRHLGVMSCRAEPELELTFPRGDAPISLPDTGPVYLRADLDGASLVFLWSRDGKSWSRIDRALDMRFLTDEFGGDDRLDFTGTFVGLCCNDLTGRRMHADFDFFTLENES